MERATYATKSFLISLALVEGELSIDQAADASRVEVLSQIKRWGEVEDCQFLVMPISPLTSDPLIQLMMLTTMKFVNPWEA